MAIKLYNNLVKEKQIFTPLREDNITMYVCGPTVYERPHIGNARSTVVYDLLFRLLRHQYGADKVTYVRNITDVDDKINNAAKARKISIAALTKEVIGYFNEDLAALNCLKPNIEPKATEHIAEMIAIIEILLSKGNAYIADNHVYFSVASFKDYTKLSGRTLEDLVAGSRIDVNENKKHPADFVLWKPADEDDDPSAIFSSPWGDGRPGWHIECSAMSTKYLGHNFDIHGGGVDLIFPHHTNEIAQSCACFEHSSYAKYWIHNGFLTVNGEKMSKSLGNFFSVKELLDKNIPGEVIRYVLLATHYRKPLNWNDKSVLDAQKSLDSFYRVLEDAKAITEPVDITEIIDEISDDLNVPSAFSKLHALVKEYNKTKDKILAAKLYQAGKLLGFFEKTPAQWFDNESNTEIDNLVEQRVQAKKDKNWALADDIRNQLKAQNITLEDHPDGSSTWRKL